MATTPYTPVNFQAGPLDRRELQQLSNNAQWLFEHSPRMVYLGKTIKRSEGLKIASGKMAYGTSNRDYTNIEVLFGNFFSVGCQPAVTTGIQSNSKNQRRMVVIKGLNTYDIDNRGFRGHITTHEFYANRPTSNWKLTSGGVVYWIAVGW